MNREGKINFKFRIFVEIFVARVIIVEKKLRVDK